ncbi:double-strand-break repair protein rad21 [Nannochloropsis oceanica]
MFYAQLILGKKGSLGKVWLAVHSEKKLNRNIIFSTDVTKSADRIANHKGEAMPLRVSGSLLLGVVRIYSHKVRYLSTDCDEALSKIKVAFRPGAASNLDPLGAGFTPLSTCSTVASGGAAIAGTPGQQLEFQGEGMMTRKGKEREGGIGRGVGTPFYREPLPLFSLSQRSTLEGSLPPLREEWMEAAAMTLARKQDIRMPEGEPDGGREGGRSALEQEEEKELVFERRLSQEEMEVQRAMEEGREGGMSGEGGAGGGAGRQNQMQGSLADGRGGGMEEEEWEAFDPLKVGVKEGEPSSAAAAIDTAAAAATAAAGRKRRFEDMDDEEEGREGGDAVDEEGDYLNYYDGNGTRMCFDDEVEGGREGGNPGKSEEREEGMEVEVERGGGERRSSMGGEDDSVLLAMGCLRSPEGGREKWREGGLLSPMATGTPDHDLPPSFVGGRLQVEEGGKEDEVGDEYDIAGGKKIRFSSSSSSSLFYRRGSRGRSLGGGGRREGGRKRRLGQEKAMVLTGAEMKARLANWSDLVLPRVRPRDRVRMEGRRGERREAGVEGRMQAHVLVGELSEDLEGMVRGMMKPVQHFRLPVAARTGRGEEGALDLGGGMEGRVTEERKRRREEEEEKEAKGDEEEAAIDEGPGYENDFHISDDEYYHYRGPTGQEEGKEEEDLCQQHHNQEDEDEDDENFIRTNDMGIAAAAGDDNIFGEKAATQWHPNTVRFCKLLRTRMAAVERKQQHGQERGKEGGGGEGGVSC